MSILDEVLLSSQNSVTLHSAQMLLRTLTTNPKLSDTVDTAQLLEDVLEDIGFGGLWVSSTFHSSNERDGHCTVLTDKLIEVSTTSYLVNESMLTLVAAHHHITLQTTGLRFYPLQPALDEGRGNICEMTNDSYENHDREN